MSLAFDTNVGFTALSVLASRCALIDDQAFSVKHFLDMDQSEAAPIFFMLNRQLVEIHKSVGSPT
jgi:hypothetical protein